mmetsp:Transcript_35489/g.91238  ORF Transcript_35489/g.91238 Transcript_35489/m.91238 type:complete len:221 (+) Transcript_35489:1-663(+)
MGLHASSTSSSARHRRSAAVRACGSCSMVKWVPGTLSTEVADVQEPTRAATSPSPWKVLAWNSRTIFSARRSPAGAAIVQVSAAFRVTTLLNSSGSVLPRAPSAPRRSLYHCEVSCTCSMDASTAGLSSLAAVACCSSLGTRAISSSLSAYLAPSGAVCESSARSSSSPVAAKAPLMSASMTGNDLGSSSTTIEALSPWPSATRAISRQTEAPKEWPAKW